MEILLCALVAVGFWLIWRANQTNKFDINQDGKVDSADARAAVVKVEEAVVKVEEAVVAEVKAVAKKATAKKPAAKKVAAKKTPAKKTTK